MAFGPKKKHSKSRTKKRTSNWIKITAKKLAGRVMFNQQKNGLSHFISEDGMYKGKQIIKMQEKKKKVTRV